MNARTRNRYLEESVSTASPAILLVRLYDRLVLDLERGEQAVAAGDRAAANEELCHAQRIISELHATLDTSVWSGGESLAQLYVWCLEQLVQANVAQDAPRVAAVRELLEPLREAWQEAARSVQAQPAGAASLTA